MITLIIINATVKNTLYNKKVIFEKIGDLKFLIVNIDKKKNIHSEILEWNWMLKLLSRCTKKHILYCTCNIYWNTHARGGLALGGWRETTVSKEKYSGNYTDR